MHALDEIKAERRRQIEIEGWTPEHDDEHERGHLLRAVVIYLWWGTDKAAPMADNGAPLSWPWEPAWFKPRDRRSNLIRAGALALAEKEAIQRAQATPAHTGHVDQKLEIIIRELDALALPPPPLSDGGEDPTQLPTEAKTNGE